MVSARTSAARTKNEGQDEVLMIMMAKGFAQSSRYLALLSFPRI